jgi:tetratricopeptide (TPR) repeat protein
MKKRALKTTASSIQLLNFAVVIAVSTFGVLALAEAAGEIVNETGNRAVDVTASMSAFDRGQYYFNADDDPAGPYDLNKAREAYTEAITASSTGNVLAWYQLGRIDFIVGRFDSALANFEKQQEYFGDTLPNVYYMIGLTYGFKARRTNHPDDWQKGIEAFEKYITFEPSSPWPRVDLAWLLFSQARFDEMIPLLEEGLEYSPGNPWLLNMHGLALLNTGKKAEALTQFQSADFFASALTEEEWGKSYPGNSPSDWSKGLASFRGVIKKNIELAAGSNTQ